MSFHVMHLMGDSERDFPVERFDALLDELLEADDEHPDVAVTHESEWSIGVFRSGLVIFENLEEGEPRHMRAVPREQQLALMRLVAEGRIDELAAFPWKPGYG